MKIYWYELLFRGISPGCHPRSGFVTSEHDHTNKRGFNFGAVAYQRELTEKEISDYELRAINAPRELNEIEYLFIK